MQNVCLEMTQDAFFAVTQAQSIFQVEKVEQEADVEESAPTKEKEPAKRGKNDAAADEVEDEEPLPDTFEAEILQDNKYSDAKDKIKSLEDVVQEMPESNFYIQKSNLSIFRYEDVIFAIFPHLAALKRRGASTKEIFFKNDPFSKKEGGAEPAFQPAQFAENSDRGGELAGPGSRAAPTSNLSRAGVAPHQASYGYQDASPSNLGFAQTDSKLAASASNMNYTGQTRSINNVQDLPVQKSYDIPTIKVLNPELYKEMEKKQRQMRDPIYQSLRNIKERHTYLENRQQRIDKRNAEIARELEERNEEKVRQ